MANPWVWGPCDIWVRFPGLTPAFLGHGEEGPDVRFRPDYDDVRVDIGGRTAFDTTYQGQEAAVTIALTRYNENVYTTMMDYVKLVGGAVGGTNGPGEIGTLMVTEAPFSGTGSMELFLPARYYASKPAFATAAAFGLVGLHFVASFLINPDWGRLGTRARRPILTWRCLRTFNPTTTNAFGFGSLTLYDFNMAPIAGLPIN